MSENDAQDQVFLSKLTKIIEENLGNKQFGVNQLAQEMGMSRSQIHRRLRKIIQKSISQYIREIRLQKALKLLQDNVATVSEISYQVGFSSPAYFIRCFKSYYGYTPGEVKKTDHLSFTPSSKSEWKKGKLLKAVMIFLGISAIISSLYIANPQIFGLRSERKIADKSIAIVPFNCLSSEIENQYFADGVMEEILNRLSKIRELKVISRTSSEKFRGSLKTPSQIAKELNVAYILEGSVQKHDNEARIFVQLIEAQNNENLWSYKFDAKFENLLTVQSNIAKQVASKMEAFITPEEIKQVEKIQTTNLQAYNSYLKGRFFGNKRTKESLETSIKYFQKSIELDSTYAMAYSGLADIYLIISSWHWYPRKEGFSKAKKYAQKAVSIDESLAEAHATLGAIAQWCDFNWTEAEKELQHAIELNNNSSRAHCNYAEYLTCIGKLNEAIAEIDKARELDPLSLIINSLSGCFYYQLGFFERALELHKNVLELDPDFRYAHIDIFYIYLKQGKDDEAADELIKYLRKNPFDKLRIPSMKEAYAKSGREGMLLWLIDLQIAKKAPEPYFLAELHAKLGKKEKALDWLEVAFKNRENLLHRLKRDRNLENLHDEPRYQAILEKMGVKDY